MPRYLLVLHELDDCAELLRAAQGLASADRDAEFVLVVPAAAAPLDLVLEPSGSALKLARQRAQNACRQLRAAGVNLVAARLGSFDPFRAVEDATRFSSYDAVVVAAPAHRLLHLMRCDLPCRLARRFRHTRFIHATALGVEHGRLSLVSAAGKR